MHAPLSRLLALGCVAALAAATLLSPAPASAAPADDVQALYEAAKADLKEKRFVFALKKFKQALALAKDDAENEWRMILGAALAYEQMGQVEFTLEYYRLFLDSVERHRAAVTDKWTNRIRVVEDQVSVLENTLLGERGVIDLNSTPPGARITIDGNMPGADGNATTPFPVYATPGTHVLRVEKDGFAPTELTVQVKLGAREARTVQLAEKRIEGRLMVATGAPDASVKVDGDAVGTGSNVSVKVAAGSHVVRVERTGFKVFEKRVDVGADAMVRVEALLQAEGPGAAAGIGSSEAGAAVAKARAYRAPLWGYLGAGGGAALVVVGGVFTALRNSDVDSIATIDRKNPANLTTAEKRDLLARRNSLSSSVDTKGAVAGVFYGLGGAAIVGSAVYLAFFADWHGAEPAGRAATLPTVMPLPGGAGLSFQGTF